jgi:hypothetical protein
MPLLRCMSPQVAPRIVLLQSQSLDAIGVKADIPNGPPPWLEDACGVIFERESVGEPASADGKPHSTSASIQGLGYLLTALRRQRLASDKLVLQLATFMRSHGLFLELSVRTPRTPRTLTANQVRQSGKQSTDGR